MLRRRVTSLLCLFLLCLLAIPCAYGAEAETEQGVALACVKAPEGRGNPVWFGKRYFGALSALRGDIGGRSILAQHSKEVLFYPAEQAEVTDIDTPPCKS